MKTSSKTLALLTSLTVMASSAFALPTVVLTPGLVTESPQYYGGEFTANSATLSNSSYAASAQSGSGFETFCMAYDQEFYYGEVLGYTLTNHTNDGPGNTAVPLAAGVAFLYSQFAKGNLVISTGAQDSDFQLALWWLQNSNGAPSTGAYNAANAYENLAYTTLGGAAAAQAAAGSNNYGVSIILTTNPDGTYSQPQLYYSVPDNGTTIALLGAALVGLVGFRRRFAR